MKSIAEHFEGEFLRKTEAKDVYEKLQA